MYVTAVQKKHLVLSNSIVSKKEQQYSEKDGGLIAILFENDKPYSELIKEENFDLSYISKKNMESMRHMVKKLRKVFTLHCRKK